MTDILLTQNLDFQIVNGDLSVSTDDDCDFQDLNYLMNLNTADNKQFPLMGTNLVYYKNGDLQDCINKLQEQFTFTKLPVKQVYQTIDNKLKIVLESNYLIIDLSVL